MNINFFKKLGIILLSIIVAIYVIFLVLPFIISPIVNKYIPMVNTEIQKATGLNSNIDGFGVVTTPKLTMGVKLDKFEICTPNNDKVISVDNFSVKMSLLSLLAKKIEVDLVKIDSIDIKLGVNKDGSFEIEKYLPVVVETSKNEAEKVSAEPIQLPFGIRLSNHLPDIKIGEYDIEFVDLSTKNVYEIEGDKTEITDFVLNKSIKILASGNAKLANREQFVYNVKVNNKIMPDLDLHELVFNPAPQEDVATNKTSNSFELNILDIFKGIYNNKITANLDMDLLISKEGNNGYVKLDNMSIVDLPPSSADLKFKGNKINIDSSVYTAQNEISTINGYVKTGKKTDVDLNFKSKVQLNNLIRILNAVAMTFNIKDLQTLSANGSLDANFNIKSNLKTINSNGYFRLPSANVYYGLYKIGIDNINADVSLDNNNVDIKNIGFSILNQPLKFYGKITSDAKADLHLLAENLSLKGLLVACGQAVLLKENPVNSGTITLKADVVGKLDQISPTAKVLLNNIDIKNIPSNTSLKLPATNVDIVSDGKTFSGVAVSENIKVINPAASVNIQKIKANIKENVIEIEKTPVQVEKIRFDVSGKIKNYLTEKIGLDFVTEGDIKSTLTGDMNVVKQTLNLVYATVQNSTIIVPMFDKSSLTFNCNIGITGSMMNPLLSGVVNVPTLTIPEIPVVMENLVAKLNGPILKGSATVGKFASGGIVAENCSSDFSLKGENFYLNNLKGTAFDGKIFGNIIYNISNLKTTIDFHGSDMNAEKAVKGAIGISNALSGTLSFDTKLGLRAVDYEDMMKSLTGNLTFKVVNGSFGNIGRIENLLGANNIVSNGILKTTVATLSNLSGIKNTAKYDYITGEMSFSNGWANIKSIKSSGQTLAYFVYGKLHLVNMSTNLTILGRLDQTVVALLGPLGELSAEKLFSFIPKFGSLTASLVNTLTSSPKGERISEIPQLSNTNGGYKDFKVIFNGGLESSNSIKSFKWLTDVDTSAIEQQSVTETIKSLKSTVGDDITNVVDTVKSQKEALKNTANELKTLFKF